MKFDFSKSNESDFRNKLQSQLDNLTKNVLYITYRVDMIIKTLDKQNVNKHLQTQVDDYFKSPPTPPPTQGSDYPGDIEPEETDD